MEFGALWCKPQNPKCEDCPLQENCLAFENDTVQLLPVKDKKIKIKDQLYKEAEGRGMVMFDEGKFHLSEDVDSKEITIHYE